MLTLLSWLLILAGLLLAYLLLVRPALRQRAALKPYFDQLDAAEAGLWDRLTGYFRGLKTRLAAWFVVLAGLAVEAHDFILPVISGVDTTAITARIPQWAYPMVLIGLGVLFRYLRKVTTGPEADASAPAG